MPGSLDSCINSIYEPGNIPASPGTPPVRVLLKDPIEVEMLEAASADAVQYIGLSAEMLEAAAATSTQDFVGGVPRSAMLDGVFVNSAGTPRQANANGVMVNL